jgi:HAD superfamily hydrolase (TIGR01509 family)
VTGHPEPSRAAAVLFDMDGILVDSEPVWYDVEGGLVRRLGGVWSREHQARCIGGTVDATCRYIRDLTGTAWTVERIQAEVMRDMVEHFATTLPVIEGAVELVDGVHALGVPTALVSSSYRELVDAALRKLGAHRFDVTVAGDEVTRGKPDPEPYLTACHRLDVAPATAVVLEDALNGVRSAESAGCPVVVVPSVASIDPRPGRILAASVAGIDPGWLVRVPVSLAPDGLEHVEP